MNNQKFSKAQIAKVIEAKMGILTAVAKELQCSRRTVQYYVERYPELAEIQKAEREKLVDRAEIGLLELLARNEPSAIFFTLKYLGRRRGYVENFKTDFNVKMQHSGEVKVELTIERREKILQGAVERYFERRGVSSNAN